MQFVDFSLQWLLVGDHRLYRAGSSVVPHNWSGGLDAPWHVGSPGSMIQPVSSGLAGGFFTPEPPGESFNLFYRKEEM